MDINLTGQIAASLADNLRQPWYNPFINIIAGIAGGLVTGLITLVAIKITNNNTLKRDEQNRKYDLKIKVYFEILDELHLLKGSLGELDLFNEIIKENPGTDFVEKIVELTSKSKRHGASVINQLAKIQVVGNNEVLKKSVFLFEAVTENSIEKFSKAQEELANAIRNDLLRENSIDEAPRHSKSWWQFWKR